MGLLTKIFNDASDTEFKLAQDLVAIAIADGEISDAERQVITEICQHEGVSKEIIKDSLLGFDMEAGSMVPQRHRDRRRDPARLDDHAGGAYRGVLLKRPEQFSGSCGLHADTPRKEAQRRKARHGDLHRSAHGLRQARRRRSRKTARQIREPPQKIPAEPLRPCRYFLISF